MVKPQEARQRKVTARNGSSGRGKGATDALKVMRNGKAKHRPDPETPVWQKTLGALFFIAVVFAVALALGVVKIDRYEDVEKAVDEDTLDLSGPQSTVAEIKDPGAQDSRKNDTENTKDVNSSTSDSGSKLSKESVKKEHKKKEKLSGEGKQRQGKEDDVKEKEDNQVRDASKSKKNKEEKDAQTDDKAKSKQKTPKETPEKRSATEKRGERDNIPSDANVSKQKDAKRVKDSHDSKSGDKQPKDGTVKSQDSIKTKEDIPTKEAVDENSKKHDGVDKKEKRKDIDQDTGDKTIKTTTESKPVKTVSDEKHRDSQRAKRDTQKEGKEDTGETSAHTEKIPKGTKVSPKKDEKSKLPEDGKKQVKEGISGKEAEVTKPKEGSTSESDSVPVVEAKQESAEKEQTQSQTVVTDMDSSSQGTKVTPKKSTKTALPKQTTKEQSQTADSGVEKQEAESKVASDKTPKLSETQTDVDEAKKKGTKGKKNLKDGTKDEVDGSKVEKNQKEKGTVESHKQIQLEGKTKVKRNADTLKAQKDNAKEKKLKPEMTKSDSKAQADGEEAVKDSVPLPPSDQMGETTTIKDSTKHAKTKESITSTDEASTASAEDPNPERIPTEQKQKVKEVPPPSSPSKDSKKKKTPKSDDKPSKEHVTDHPEVTQEHKHQQESPPPTDDTDSKKKKTHKTDGKLSKKNVPDHSKVTKKDAATVENAPQQDSPPPVDSTVDTTLSQSKDSSIKQKEDLSSKEPSSSTDTKPPKKDKNSPTKNKESGDKSESKSSKQSKHKHDSEAPNSPVKKNKKSKETSQTSHNSPKEVPKDSNDNSRSLVEEDASQTLVPDTPNDPAAKLADPPVETPPSTQEMKMDDGGGSDEDADDAGVPNSRAHTGEMTPGDKQIQGLLKEAEKVLVKQKDFEKALHSYENILRDHPSSPSARMGRAKSLDKLAEERRSNDILQRCITAYRETADTPDCPMELRKEALSRLAERLSFFGKIHQSIKVFKELIELFPRDVDAIKNLGVQYLVSGKTSAAKPYFEKVLEINPLDGFALVHMGFIVKSEENYHEAIPFLKEGIATGERGTNEGKFYFHLGDSYYRIGKPEEAYKVYDEAVSRGHFRSRYQRSLYNVDSLRAKSLWTVKEAGFTQAAKKLENNWEAIRDEALALMNSSGYFKHEEEKLRESGDWKQLTVFAQGMKNEANCEKTPVTCGIIESIPESSGCKRGQVKFSVMQPGTHVWPHCGPTNCRLRAHLGLVIPQPVRIRVADTTRTWEEGKVFIFDDSFEHEVWQEADSFRLVLITDFWHPDLSESQRRRLTPI